MKPEIGYPDIVVGSYIEDLLCDIEWHMKFVSLRDPYFEQLSVEKFALETLLQEIVEQSDVSPFAVIEGFVNKANKACENAHPSTNYTFSVSRDAAMSILDGLYFGYLEHLEDDERGEFET